MVINAYSYVLLIGLFVVIIRAAYKSYKYYDKSLNELKQEVKRAEEEADKVILERGILSELREIINRITTDDYAKSIDSLLPQGLSEIFDPQFEIPTKAQERIKRAFRNMSGGSIGIAGPRGSGKTTLMRSVCNGSMIENKDVPLLSIMAPAPIKYDSRDFILHLFSSLCFRLIYINDKRKLSYWDNLDSLRTPEVNSRFLSSDIIRMAMVLSSIFGVIFIFIGSFITNIIISESPEKSYVDALSLNPGYFFSVGLILILISLFIYFISRPSYNQKRRIDLEMEKEDREDNIVLRDARRWLRRIKFQQSCSAGQTGSLKLPIWIEGGINSSVSLAEIPSSLPEIIEGYCDFLKQASKQYRIIIGIDELDKLRSNEDAKIFLNDIKALFGIENVFYLISVSENAMSSFERRGLPLRDAFDSAFDKIIHVEYLNLEGAKQLIKRRVIGLSTPFICICYCLSGGLARDLIRICRDMTESIQDKPDENTIPTICYSLVKSNLSLKIEAISIEAKEIWQEPEVTELFKELHEMQECLEDNCLKIGKLNLYKFQENYPKDNESEEVRTKKAKLAILEEELLTYTYYALTLVDFFNGDTDRIKKADESGLIDELAKAYQFLAANPSISRMIITDFRRKCDLVEFQPFSSPTR